MSAELGGENTAEFMEKYCPEILEKYKQLDEETSYEERRKIRAALRELRKRKVDELAKPLSESYSSSTLLTTAHHVKHATPASSSTIDTDSTIDSGSTVDTAPSSTRQEFSVITNGDGGDKLFIETESEKSVINGLNLDDINDEQELQKLIDATPLTAYNDRKRLRSRLRQLKKQRASESAQAEQTIEIERDDRIDDQPQAAQTREVFVFEHESIENGVQVSQTEPAQDKPEITEAEIKAHIAAEKAEIARATKARAKAALLAKKEQEKAQQEAKERAILEEEKAQRKAEERQRRHDEERARQEAENARVEEERARKEEERARKEKERARKEEERARKEEQTRKETERARKEEEQARKEEERARKEEERARKEEEQARKEEEQARKEDERARKEEEEETRKEEQIRKENERAKKEEERARIEEEEEEEEEEEIVVHSKERVTEEHEGNDVEVEEINDGCSEQDRDYDEYCQAYEEDFAENESVSSRTSNSSSTTSGGQSHLQTRLPTSAFKREKIKYISEHEKEAKEAKMNLRKTDHADRFIAKRTAPFIKSDVKETIDFKAGLRKQGSEPAGILKRKEQQEKEEIDFKQNLRKTGEDLVKKKIGVKKDVDVNSLDFRQNLRKTEVASDLYKSPIRKTPKADKDKPQKFQLRETVHSLPGKKVTVDGYLKTKEKPARSSASSPKLGLRGTGIHLPGRKLSREDGEKEDKPFKRITSDELFACLSQPDPALEKQKADYTKRKEEQKTSVKASLYAPIKPLLPTLSIEEQEQDYKRVMSTSSSTGRLDPKELIDIKTRQKDKLKEIEVKHEFRSVLKKSATPQKPTAVPIPEEALEWVKKPKKLQNRVTEENVDEVYRKNVKKPKEKPEWMKEKESYHSSKIRIAEVRKLEENMEAKKVNIKIENESCNEFIKPAQKTSSYMPNYTIIKKHQLSDEPAVLAEPKQASVGGLEDPKAGLHKFRNELLKAAQAKGAREAPGSVKTEISSEVKVVWSDPSAAAATAPQTTADY